jgi:SAM-dependent methyltransferase
MTLDARDVFGARAAFYTTSEAHTDEAVLARVVYLSRPAPDDVALDVGTGTGHTALALAGRVARVTGTDVTPEMLAEARALAEARGPVAANVVFELADAEALQYPDAVFDIVTCRRALHHFRHPDTALSEMRRVLRAGGRLVIDDRSVTEDDRVDEAMNRLDVLHDGSHVREYRPGELAAMVAGAGFEVTEVETYTRHRPLTSLTATAEPGDAAAIEREVASFDEELRASMGIGPGEDGALAITHWFVLLAATVR